MLLLLLGYGTAVTPPVVDEGGAGYPIRRVPRFEIVDNDEEALILAIMGVLLSD